nr:MAG TPA: hypothetical protein [Bacteriophage sp.]
MKYINFSLPYFYILKVKCFVLYIWIFLRISCRRYILF